ncbi:metallophosphoesterase family protein [Pinibacter aurantiacus]|uniref:Metallophosphoesterase n=1 Tax=Pinibacter aurantiacus TaxID=2851599 RepID=A0A9E2SBV1_9BACT|nr:metallophosphoesterase [Pinibacter aurantiacus]MBV4359277.1 metallophosphoesterase [Pinibacter aurantiacus]
MNRRSLLKSAGLFSLLPAFSGLTSFANDNKGGKKQVLRFAHLTDVHIEPEMNAPKGFASCLHSIQLQKQKPSFILNTGDCIFDALKQPKDRVETQWTLWNYILKQENSLPIEYCIGNHDCWGFGQKEDPLYGKKYALDKMSLAKPYRSFDKAGWHFIILDSIQPKNDGTWYECVLDDEQFDWLQKDLAAVPSTTPVIVASHVPLVSAATVVVDNKVKGDQGYVLGLGSMHIDAARIVELFDKFPNVKLCLSGHIHLYEQIIYNGVTYISNGAVSGNWWKGKRYQTVNGYAMVNLYDDGTFSNEYVPYSFS